MTVTLPADKVHHPDSPNSATAEANMINQPRDTASWKTCHSETERGHHEKDSWQLEVDTESLVLEPLSAEVNITDSALDVEAVDDFGQNRQPVHNAGGLGGTAVPV